MIATDTGLVLNADRLMQQAEQQTGLSNWGSDTSFRAGLECLISSVEAMGCADVLRDPVTAQVIGLLSTRLRLEEDARLHPEILEGRIDRPLIVAGLPRTGTTWLFELLSLDPGCRAPLEWEATSPWPAPEIATHDSDPRISALQAGFDAMLAAAPELATMHEFNARLPAECNAIMQLHFVSSNFWAAYSVPDYLRWLTHDRPTGMFNTHRRVLQQLQWKGPRGRWMLKSPPYMLMIDELLAAYPDACIVQTHREPAKTVASLANMVRSLRRVRFPGVDELADARQIARDVLMHFGEALERGVSARKDPAVDARIIDISYHEVITQPLVVLKRIYETFNLPWTQPFEDRVQAVLAQPRSTGHGAHRYDMAEFGIAELDLPHRFAAYRERFADMLAD